MRHHEKPSKNVTASAQGRRRGNCMCEAGLDRNAGAAGKRGHENERSDPECRPKGRSICMGGEKT